MKNDVIFRTLANFQNGCSANIEPISKQTDNTATKKLRNPLFYDCSSNQRASSYVGHLRKLLSQLYIPPPRYQILSKLKTLSLVRRTLRPRIALCPCLQQSVAPCNRTTIICTWKHLLHIGRMGTLITAPECVVIYFHNLISHTSPLSYSSPRGRGLRG